MTEYLQKNHSSFSLFLALVRGEYCPHAEWHKLKFRIKYFLRTLVYPRITFRLLNAALNDPAVRNGFLHQGMLPAKIHRPYLIADAGLRERYRFLCDHYRFTARMKHNVYHDLLLGKAEGELVSFCGKNGEAYVVHYGRSPFCREGEITFTLCQNGASLASMTFSVIYQETRPVLIVGGVQGHGSASNETMKQATKACHGLFPKRILLECIRSLGQAMSIPRIWGVSDRGHVFRNVRYRKKKGEVFVASYDAFWELAGGKKISSSVYSIPVRAERKSLESIPSNKRSAYRQRFQLLDVIDAGIQRRNPLFLVQASTQ